MNQAYVIFSTLLLLTSPSISFSFSFSTSFSTSFSLGGRTSSTAVYNSVGGTDDISNYVSKGRRVDKSFIKLLEQNKNWVRQQREENGEDYFSSMVGNHKPEYLWIGCSDARVPANEILGLGSNKVFVLRNVANMVIGTDFNAMSAIQYAVTALQIPQIIVCGHYDCGGVRASMESLDHSPPLENWLRNIRDVYRLHQDELDRIKDPEARHRRLVECNVIEQCINLFKTGVVQRRRVETFLDVNSEFTTPRIHACVFDPSTGELKQLEVDFKQYMEELHDIYDLYKIEAGGNREKEEQEIALKKKMLADLGASPNAPDQAGQNSRGWKERISKIWKGP